MQNIEYNKEFGNDTYEDECPYCGKNYGYDTADGIPDNGDGEIVQCDGCNKLFHIMAEPSIDWRTYTLAHIKLLFDIPIEKLKAGQIVLTTSSKKGDLSHRYNSEKKDWIEERKWTVCCGVNDTFTIPKECAEWLGYPNDEDGETFDPINTGDCYLKKDGE